MILGNIEKNKQPIEENVNKIISILFLFFLGGYKIKTGFKT